MNDQFNTPPYRATNIDNCLYPKTNFSHLDNHINKNTIQNSLNSQSLPFPSIDFNQRPSIKFPEIILTQPPPSAFNYGIGPFSTDIKQCFYDKTPKNISSNFNPNNGLLPNRPFQFAQQSYSYQNQSIPFRNVDDFLRFPPPPIDAPPVPNFLRFPPPNLKLNLDFNQIFNSPLDRERNANFPITSSVAGNEKEADRLFVESFSNKITSRILIKDSDQIFPKDVAGQLKELQRLQESLTALQNCIYYKADNSLVKTYNEEGAIIENCVDDCQCYSIFAEYNSNNSPMNHHLISQSILNRLKEIKSVLNEDLIKKASFKYKKYLKKKERLKKKKEILAERRREFDKKFEEWQQTIMADEKVIKEKLELQKAVEGTMSEVIMKIADLSKQLKLFSQLKKLRKIRAERRKKNEMSAEEFNVAKKKFEMRSDALEKFINNRMSNYKDEEHTLKVMLDVEAEVDAETLIRRRKKEEQIRMSTYKKQLHEYLFGKKIDIRPEDPLFSFNQHYKMAEDNIHNFLAIRSEWDTCVVNEGHENSSSVPLTYILPPPPSTSQWAEYLQK